MNDIYEIACSSLKHYDEELCGDMFHYKKKKDKITAVLADGLGSGVKANILATLTSKILMTMLSNDIGIEDAVETVLDTLPVCKVREIAYSTFSLVQLVENGVGTLFEYDNVQALYLSKDGIKDLPFENLTICGKSVRKSNIELDTNEAIILMTDGVINANSSQYLNFNWTRDNVRDYLQQHMSLEDSANEIASKLITFVNDLYLNKSTDDATVVVVKRKPRCVVNIMVGPPAHEANDTTYVSNFLKEEGYHVVCGGTTAKVVARYLNKEIIPINENEDYSVPPMSQIEGIDLVTEGLVTLKKVLLNAKDFSDIYSKKDKLYNKNSGCDKISKLLLNQATDIHFYVGQGSNVANISSKDDSKLEIMNQLIQALEAADKNVTVYRL